MTIRQSRQIEYLFLGNRQCVTVLTVLVCSFISIPITWRARHITFALLLLYSVYYFNSVSIFPRDSELDLEARVSLPLLLFRDPFFGEHLADGPHVDAHAVLVLHDRVPVPVDGVHRADGAARDAVVAHRDLALELGRPVLVINGPHPDE